MEVKLVHQINRSDNLYDYIKSMLSPLRSASLKVINSFTFLDSNNKLLNMLLEFINNGNDLKMVLGLGGRQIRYKDILSLYENFGPRRVFFYGVKNNSKLLHLKYWLVERSGLFECLLGSANLTAGGLFNNFELVLHLSLNGAEDSRLISTLRDVWLYYYKDDSGRLKSLNKRLLNALEKKYNLIPKADPDTSRGADALISGIFPSTEDVPLDQEDGNTLIYEIMAEPSSDKSQFQLLEGVLRFLGVSKRNPVIKLVLADNTEVAKEVRFFKNFTQRISISEYGITKYPNRKFLLFTKIGDHVFHCTVVSSNSPDYVYYNGILGPKLPYVRRFAFI